MVVLHTHTSFPLQTPTICTQAMCNEARYTVLMQVRTAHCRGTFAMITYIFWRVKFSTCTPFIHLPTRGVQVVRPNRAPFRRQFDNEIMLIRTADFANMHNSVNFIYDQQICTSRCSEELDFYWAGNSCELNLTTFSTNKINWKCCYFIKHYTLFLVLQFSEIGITIKL